MADVKVHMPIHFYVVKEEWIDLDDGEGFQLQEQNHYFCFRHAVAKAVSGEKVEVEVARSIQDCRECYPESVRGS